MGAGSTKPVTDTFVSELAPNSRARQGDHRLGSGTRLALPHPMRLPGAGEPAAFALFQEVFREQ